MSFISFKHIGKSFIEEKNEIKVLNDISLDFPNHGFISVVGKSGCGKSTLLNIVGRLEKPSNGKYYYESRLLGHNDKKEISSFLNQYVGIVFQHYNLFNDLSSLENVILPMLIKGENYSISVNRGKELLGNLGFDEDLFYKKVSLLSGGEKQRIAIARAICNKPKLLLCDEPTGALDSENSRKVMAVLKQISNERLVIVVSHNLKLVDQYSDRIIYLKNGLVEKDITNNEINELVIKPCRSVKSKVNRKFTKIFVKANLKRRFKRHILSFISLFIGIVSTILVFGFITNAPTRIDEESYNKLDYGVSKLSVEKKENIPGSSISLINQTRPSANVAKEVFPNDDMYVVSNNYECIVPENISITYNSIVLPKLLYKPIYSFIDESINKSLLVQGRFPNVDNLDEVVINESAYQLISSKGKLDYPLKCSSVYESMYYTFNPANDVIYDTFVFDKKIKVVGVVKELNFLSSPTVFYSFRGLEDYLDSYVLNNLSSYLQEEVSWKKRVTECANNDQLSAYSLNVFCIKNSNFVNIRDDMIKANNRGLVLSNNSIVVSDALMGLIDAASVGVEMFVSIAIIGTILIIGVISFYSYSEDRKRSAILSSIGCRTKEIFDIYLSENIIVCLSSLLFSFMILPLAIRLSNQIVNNITKINNLVLFPFKNMHNLQIIFVFCCIICVFVVVMLSTTIPILLSKKIQISKELHEE